MPGYMHFQQYCGFVNYLYMVQNIDGVLLNSHTSDHFIGKKKNYKYL